MKPALCAAALSVLLAFGCSNRKQHPPSLSGSAVENPRSCADIQSASSADQRVMLDGKPAQCAVDGLSCPLGKNFNGSIACALSQSRFAFCENTFWRLDCIDAGAPRIDADSSVLDGAIDAVDD